MSLVNIIKDEALKAVNELYSLEMNTDDITVSLTKPEFEGNYTIVLFALTKTLRKKPEELGQEIGTILMQSAPGLFTGFNVVKGFLNLNIADAFFTGFLYKNSENVNFGRSDKGRKRVIVEYSSPNTNKPLHLGHLRNNFLGWSVSEILKESGNEVLKTCIVNDRGIHICKSMIAWKTFAQGATPESTGKKGDHFVGDYYVAFSNEHKKEMQQLQEKGLSKEEAEKKAPIMLQTQEMLLDWEKGEPGVMALWSTMNGWVYKGFDETYKRIGSDFDKIYYESETYLLGKTFVEQGLEKGVLHRKEDGSVWIDLSAEGLDEKLLLRKDGTSVYITQDLGLAEHKYKDFPYDQSIYVIADEQNYHMKVLQLILKKLELPFADGIFHLSYGMVELPDGRMKSREGTVVDADDLMDEMVEKARQKTQEKSDLTQFSQEDLSALYETIALGALKFFLIRVDPKKKMVFNPDESIDFQGFTGPFIQYTHARIKSILRQQLPEPKAPMTSPLLPLEKELLILLEQYTETVELAAKELNPASIANYVYSVAKVFNSFYTEHKVLKAETEEKKQLRLNICNLTAIVLKRGMHLLGIRVPERM